jgi:AGZA family xanthine/uracil permease-like MFS transporter
MSKHSFDPPWFVRKDLDGFFGLMIDNLSQHLLIVSLIREVIHLPDCYTIARPSPLAGFSIVEGIVF